MPWDYVARRMLGDAWNDKYGIDSRYPDYVAWAERVKARPAVKNALTGMQRKHAEESSD